MTLRLKHRPGHRCCRIASCWRRSLVDRVPVASRRFRTAAPQPTAESAPATCGAGRCHDRA